MADKPTLILLPGMDGTGKLFRPLLEVIPTHWPTRVISYYPDRLATYSQNLRHLERELEGAGRLVLLGESYSGPIALRFAAAHPQRVAALILCATFISPPLPRWLRWITGRWMFWVRPPGFAVRALLLGRTAPDSLTREVQAAIALVRPAVMARRTRDVLDVQCGDALRACAAPILYLGGTRDVLVGRRGSDPIQSLKPEVNIAWIDGPHLLLQRQPLEAWKEIDRFLANLPDSASGAGPAMPDGNSLNPPPL